MRTLEDRIADFLDTPYTQPIDHALDRYHRSHANLIYTAKGSNSKHQAWSGGYKYHVEQCLDIAETLYRTYHFPFPFRSVLLVLYFHDIEKIFKYAPAVALHDSGFLDEAALAIKHKEQYYKDWLPANADITFSDEELNALKYVHGEGDDYCEQRVMNELAGLCHAADVMSARCFYDKRVLEK